MKKREAYPFISNEDKTKFRFTSTGPKGGIEKIVVFSPYLGDTFNLAFGDALPDGDFDDATISNNEDMRDVLQTIANIVHEFLEEHPNKKIYIEPVDRKRKLLYNRIFQKKWNDIMLFFEAYGLDFGKSEIEPYSNRKTYDAFSLSKKP